MYAKEHREAAKARAAKWYRDNPDRVASYYSDTTVKRRRAAYMKVYRKREGPRKRKRSQAYDVRRCRIDPVYKLSVNLRKRLSSVIRGGAKTGSAVRNLGCSVAELKQYLEARFLPGMTWVNWGREGWHIDHIRPLSSFDLTNPEQLKQAVHYTNLQPLWAIDNLIKGARVPESLPEIEGFRPT